MEIKCVVLDADGVVIDSDMFSVDYEKEHDVGSEDMLPFFNGVFQDCLIGKADLVEEVEPWLPKWDWDGTVDEFLQYWFEAEHNVDDRVIDFVKKLRGKGIKCYLATNQEKYRTQYMKDAMGLEEVFDHVFSSADIGYKKPEKEFYGFILNEVKNEHGIYPHEVAFFDDSEKNVEGASNMDINAYLYNDFEDMESVLRDIV